jgi:glycosyltransferase involved in cell wall biosynthesis
VRVEKVDLVCFGCDAWSGMWKRNQMMISLLSKEPWVRRTLFVNPEVWVGNLAARWSVESRPPTRYAWQSIVPRRVMENVWTFTPCNFPFSRLKASRRAKNRAFRLVFEATIQSPYVVLINAPIDPAEDPLPWVLRGARTVVFDWADDFETFAENPSDVGRVRAICDFYLRTSTVVFAVNDRLRQRALRLNGATYTVRNATDADNFGRAAVPQTPKCSQVQRRTERVIGYVGWISAARLDEAILREIVTQRPEWRFVFVGPVVGRSPFSFQAELPQNVELTGPIDYGKLPEAMKTFDVCILPNKINPHTDGNDPIKLYDYLATGKPIVATRTAGTERLGDLIRLATGPVEFLEQLDLAAGEEDDELAKRRRAAACKESWQERIRGVAEVMHRAITGSAAVQPAHVPSAGSGAEM